MEPLYEEQIRYQLEEKKQDEAALLHPCFNNKIHGQKGRLHLPVSPYCNIQCRFCTRSCNQNENRPGVSAGILPVAETVGIVEKALSLCPDITVVGIAGPGDTLASNQAMETFTQVHQAYPRLIKCLSTNGLALPGKGKALFDVGVRTITVTVNGVYPEIVSQIVSHIIWQGRVIRGTEAADILIRQQLAGIQEVCALGMLVKVNTVLIPSVNDYHIEDIARAVKLAGATVHNILPLIPQHELAHLPAPDCQQIHQARADAEKYLPQFRHCQHCRADACGVIGKKDLSRELYGDRQLETFSHG